MINREYIISELNKLIDDNKEKKHKTEKEKFVMDKIIVQDKRNTTETKKGEKMNKKMFWFFVSLLGICLVLVFTTVYFATRQTAKTTTETTEVVTAETEARINAPTPAELTSSIPKAADVVEINERQATGEIDNHGDYPQSQIGHPNFYVETGTNAAYKWTFEVKDKEIGIVGGLVVDDMSGGVYRAYGPGKYTVTVQNGFVLTTQKEWGQNEFMFRIGQAIQYNWAHGTIDYGPLTQPK